MANPLDIGPNNVNFPDWPANFLSNEVTAPLTPDILQGLYAAGVPAPLPPANSLQRAALRNTFSKTIQAWASLPPTTWAQFANYLVLAGNGFMFTNLDENGNPISLPSEPITSTTVAALRTGFIAEFKALTGADTDWSILSPSATIDTFFDQAFNKFLTEFQPSPTLPPTPTSSNLNPDSDIIIVATSPETTYTIPSYYLDFINQFRNFLTTSVLVQIPGSVPLVSGSGVDLTNHLADLASYESLYFAYAAPGTTRATFISDLQAFYANQISNYGFFTPSHFFASWQLFVSHRFLPAGGLPIFDENTVALNLPAAGPSSLAGNNSYKALVLNRIIKLLIQMTSILQNVAVTQTVRLRFATQYQQVYTSMMSQIPVFISGGSSIIERVNNPNGMGAPFNTPTGGLPPASTQQAKRNELNATFNSVLTDKMRAYRGIYEDRAKQYQTIVNQSNDAVNQQTDMLTSFTQQISSLLSSVLR